MIEHVDNNATSLELPKGDELEAAIKEAQEREAEYLGKGKPAPAPVAKPDDVPEEFWDAETGKIDWNKVKAAKAEETKAEDEQSSTDEQSADVEEVNGVKLTEQHSQDFAPWYEALQKGEALPDEAVEYVEKTFGVKATKGMIEAYMKGQLAKVSGQQSEQVNEVRSEVLSAVGGEDQYKAIAEWAVENLTDAEIEAYNAAVEGSDPKAARLAAENLKLRMAASVDQPPARRIGTGRPSAPPADGYASIDEMTADMMDPRYKRDPAYRAKVEAKIARSGNVALPSY